MTDCKHFPDQSNLFVPKNGRQQEFEPANSWCDTNPLRFNSSGLLETPFLTGPVLPHKKTEVPGINLWCLVESNWKH